MSYKLLASCTYTYLVWDGCPLETGAVLLSTSTLSLRTPLAVFSTSYRDENELLILKLLLCHFTHTLTLAKKHKT